MPDNGVPAILFIIFSQPEVTAQTFAAIREARPRKLYVAADGPRPGRPGEAEECAATRAVVDGVDWDCECITWFRTENAGCRKNVSEAVTWFLEAEGEGIILEYDCLPHPDFFRYCAVLLERYRDDNKVMSICGSNLQFGRRRGDGDYFFARLPNTWGWATWKRAWRLWEGDLTSLPKFIEQREIENLLSDGAVKKFLLGKFLDVYHGRNRTTWGFAWVYAHLACNSMSIYPNANLISNLGFSSRATHAVDEKSVFSRIPLEGLATFGPPTFAIPCIAADEYIVKLSAWRPWYTVLYSTFRRSILAMLPAPMREMLKAQKAKMLSRTHALAGARG